MRNLQLNISTVGTYLRQGSQLISRIEDLRSLRAHFSALHLYAFRLVNLVRNPIWQVPSVTGLKPAMARCMAPATSAQAMQHKRRHEITCHAAAAPRFSS